MQILPRWFQIGFIGFFAVLILTLLVLWPVFYTDLGDLESFRVSEISELSLHGAKGTIQNVPTSSWGTIESLVVNSDWVLFTGYRGEEFTYFCSLLIRRDSDFLGYTLDLYTRPSMGGDVALRLQRGSPGSHWSYGTYSGNALLRYLRAEHPETCFPYQK